MAYLVMRRLRVVAGQIVGGTLPGLVYGGQINSERSEGLVLFTLLIHSDNEDQRSLYMKQIEDAGKRVDESVQKYRGSIFEKEDWDLFNRLVATRKNCREIRLRIFALLEENRRVDAQRMFENELLPAYADSRKAGEALFDYNVKQGHDRGIQIEVVCRRTQWIVAISSVAVFLGGFFTPFFAIRLPPRLWS